MQQHNELKCDCLVAIVSCAAVTSSVRPSSTHSPILDYIILGVHLHILEQDTAYFENAERLVIYGTLIIFQCFHNPVHPECIIINRHCS